MTETLQRKLAEMNPALVMAMQADGTTRPLKPKPNGTTRKRWMHLIEALDRMAWTSLELQDGKGNIIGVLDNPDAVAESEASPVVTHEQYLKTMIAAQREALTWQDKSVRSALDTCVQVMRQAIEMMAVQQRTYQMQIDAVAEIASGTAAGPNDDIRSTPLVEAMLPLLLARIGGVPLPPQTRKIKPNGAKEEA